MSYTTFLRTSEVLLLTHTHRRTLKRTLYGVMMHLGGGGVWWTPGPSGDPIRVTVCAWHSGKTMGSESDRTFSTHYQPNAA